MGESKKPAVEVVQRDGMRGKAIEKVQREKFNLGASIEAALQKRSEPGGLDFDRESVPDLCSRRLVEFLSSEDPLIAMRAMEVIRKTVDEPQQAAEARKSAGGAQIIVNVVTLG